MKQQISNRFSVCEDPEARRRGHAQRQDRRRRRRGARSRRTIRATRCSPTGCRAGHFFQAKIDGLTGYDDAARDPSNDPGRRPRTSRSPTSRRRGTRPPSRSAASRRRQDAAAAATSTITVLNGNGVAGAATNAAYLLGQRGYRIVVPRERRRPQRAELRLLPHEGLLRPAAGAARRLRGAARSPKAVRRRRASARLPARLRATARSGAMLTVVVGQTFHGTLAPAPVDKTLKKQPPTSARTRPQTGSLLEQRAQARCRSGSWCRPCSSALVLDPEVPVRDVHGSTKGEAPCG